MNDLYMYFVIYNETAQGSNSGPLGGHKGKPPFGLPFV